MGERALKRAVFLDRDGVINQAIVRDGRPYPPPSVHELVINPDAPQAMARLHDAGFALIVVTNQPDLARGRQTRKNIDEIHAALKSALPLDAIYLCDHDDADRCACRKPNPGMLLDAARDFGLDLKQSFLIGDRWRDIDAGARAGCRTILIECGYTDRAPAAPPDFTVRTLSEAVDRILTMR